MQSVRSKEAYVFGLDIGTRSIVGTVGYREKDRFVVVAQAAKEHETRAMLDGQIHDIAMVAGTIKEVKEILEKKIKRKLKNVCIAAAGRVLRTKEATVTIDFDEDTLITEDIIYELDSTGVEKAYEIFQNENQSGEKFYCVGHSVVRYTLNGHPITNLENHKGKQIGMELIATFLPYDVVDGLYSAVEMAGLEVANLTLEPIAAIEVAIPEKFRMLNIALVDIGAGTSDICITKEGSVSAYGMIPVAGDSLTEILANHCLVEFAEAEKIKRGIAECDSVEYEDIMGLTQSINKQEVLDVLSEQVEVMTTQICETITSLNGDKPVSAIFVVGGGGRIEGFTSKLAEKMGIQVQRVALRGEDVMTKINFLDDTLTKDSMLITPLGICLNFYEQNNNFIYVSFNDERIKLYDNGKLSIVDAVMQAGISNDSLFPKRGKELKFYLNKKEKVVKGQLGEAAVLTLNGEPADIHTLIHSNDIIRMIPSTAGKKAEMNLDKLKEAAEEIEIIIDGINIPFPKIVTVNGELVSDHYSIKKNDKVMIQDYYTVEQVLTFLDLTGEQDCEYYVNNTIADMETKVYNRFSFEMKEKSKSVDNSEIETFADLERLSESDEEKSDSAYVSKGEETKPQLFPNTDKITSPAGREAFVESDNGKENDNPKTEEVSKEIRDLHVIVNKMPICLKGKTDYYYVDVFDYIDFDLSHPKGKGVVTTLNGRNAEYLEYLSEGDIIEIYWRD